jgi:glyoxylase-like metal-dependent hydrolase (beta-lactamase superfamily II)
MTPDLPVVHPWFRAEDAGGGITRLFEPAIDYLLWSNVWHVPGRDADLIVDAANGVGPLRPAVEAISGARPLIAFATHGHLDHVGGLHEFDDRRVHADDAEMTRDPFPLRLLRSDFVEGTEDMWDYYGLPVPEVVIAGVPERGFEVAGWVTPGAEPTRLLADGNVLDLGDRRFTVIHTPGHTAGSACLFEESSGVLFTGDALYVDARLSWDDEAAAVTSLERLRELDVSVAHAGHERSFDGAELRTACEAAIRAIETGTV